MAYGQYLQGLNVSLTTRYSSTQDQQKIIDLRTKYNDAAHALRTFEKTAEADWKQQKLANPGLSRIDWDNNYGDIGYTPMLKELTDDVTERYGYWQGAAHPYPELTRVINRIYDYDNNPANAIYLPETTDDLSDPPESWTRFLKTNLNLPDDFFTHDAVQDVALNQSSSTSTNYESRWEAGGSVSYGFFSIGGSAGGGNIEDHLRAGTQNLTFSFKRLVPVEVLRGQWYDEGLLAAPFNTYVDASEYWNRGGQLPLIPTTALIGRGLEVSIQTSSTVFDEFQSWYHSSGSLGFSFGPWSVGGGANQSTSSSSITNTSSGTTLSFTDDSDTPYIIAVASIKMEDWVNSRSEAMAIGREKLEQLIRSATERDHKVPKLVE
jgi:hypothetical protein